MLLQNLGLNVQETVFFLPAKGQRCEYQAYYKKKEKVPESKEGACGARLESRTGAAKRMCLNRRLLPGSRSFLTRWFVGFVQLGLICHPASES